MAAVATAAAAARADTDTVTIMVAIGDGAVTTVMITPTTVNSTTIHRNNTTIRDFLPLLDIYIYHFFFCCFFVPQNPFVLTKKQTKQLLTIFCNLILF